MSLRRFLLLLVILTLSQALYSQSKLNITATLPSSFDVCGDGVSLSIDARNITTSAVSGNYLNLELPPGVEYVKSSVSGSGISERNVSDLNKPSFNLPDLGLAQSSTLKMDIRANCDVIPFLNAGKLAVVKVNANYSGGSVDFTSTPMSIYQPSLQIKSVSNRFIQTDLYEVFIRKITLVNSGKGRLSDIEFYQTNESDLTILGTSGGRMRTSSDTIFSSFSSSEFTAIGNNDGYMDQGEEVVIIDTVRTDGCDKLASRFATYWGCDNDYCQIVTSSANVTLQTKLPDLLVIPSSGLNSCLKDGNTFDGSLQMINRGQDTARNVEIQVFQAAGTGFYTNMMSRLHDSSFTYRLGKNGTPQSIYPQETRTTNSGGIYSCLGTNPVGFVSLSLPNMVQGDTIYIDWKVSSCCPGACDINFYVNRWNYSGTYRDRCDKVINIVERRASNGYYSRLNFSSYAPSDVRHNDTVLFNYSVTNANLIPPTPRAKYVFDFVKSNGIGHSFSSADFYFIDIRGRIWRPNVIQDKGDTVRAIFYGYVPITLSRAELKIISTVSCNPASNEGEYDYRLDVTYNPDTACQSCAYRMDCSTEKIKIHCQSACGGGLHFSDFDVNRMSYGLPDNDNDGLPDTTGTLDFNRIKTERAMYGDTILAVFKGKFYDQGSTTTWRYLYASSYIPYGTYLDVAEARLKIYRNNNLLYSCDGIKTTFSNSGVNRTYNFDAGIPALISASCPLYSGFTFTKRDSVELHIKYVVATNPGNAIRNVDFTNSFYTSTTANPTAAQRLQCDTFSGRSQLLGYYFTNYGSNLFQTNSCQTVDVVQNFYLSVGPCCANYAGGNIFPFEYRSWAKLDEIVIRPPKGYKTVFAKFGQYRTSGTGFTSYEEVDTIKPYFVSGDSVKYKVSSFYKDKKGPINLSDDGFHGTFRARLLPTCETENGESEVHYDFGFEKLNYLGSGVDWVASGGYRDRLVYDAPSVALTVAQKFVPARSDTIEWDIRLSNVSSKSTAEYLWISSNVNPNVRLVEVLNTTTGASILADSGVFKMGDLPFGQALDLTLRAVFVNCDIDSLELQIGYDCQGYPSSINNLKCASISQILSYQPINTRLEATLRDSLMVVDLCAPVWYEVNITNIGEARVFGTYLDLVLREGMQLSDTAWLSGGEITDSILITGPVSLNALTKRWELFKYDSALKNNGLAGINGSNQLKLRFRLKTDCDFVSSSFFLARPGGSLKCGRDVLSAYEIGESIDIKGVNKPYFSSLSVKMNPMDVCDFNNEVEIKLINLGPDTTRNSDKIRMSLPPGFSIDTSFLRSYNNTPDSVEIEEVNGSKRVSWKIPKGIVPGDSLHFATAFSVDLRTSSCGISEVLTQALVEQPAFCVEQKTWCDIDVATSTVQILDSVRKGDYYLSYNLAKGQPQGTLELIDLNYNVENRGTNKRSGEVLKILVVFDKDADGVFEPTDSVIYSDTILNQLNRGQTSIRNIQFATLPVASCNLMLVVDSSACSCAFRSISLPPVSIVNAGTDTTVCSGETAPIGSQALTGNKYSWSFHSGIDDRNSAQTSFTHWNSGTADSTYNLVLVTDKGACISYDTVEVTVLPRIRVSLPDTVPMCIGNRAFIGQNARGGSGSLTYSWDPTTSLTSPTLSRTWAEPASTTRYIVTIRDDANCVEEDTTVVKVLKLPITSITVQDTCVDSLVQLFNSSTTFNGPFNSFFWDIGPVIKRTEENPVVSFLTPGKYLVNLSVTDSMGCSGSASDSIEIFPNPTAALSASDLCEGDSVWVRGNSSIPAGSVIQTWYYGGRSQIGDSIQLSFSDSGWYVVTLKASSVEGCADLARDSVYVYSTPVGTVASGDNCLGDSTSLSLSVQRSLRDSVTGFQWDLGDGSSSNQLALRHLYSDTGTYTVEVYLESQFGCSDTVIGSVTIHPNPVALVIGSDICSGEDLIFVNASNISSGTITDLYWDYGSGFTWGTDTLRLSQQPQGMTSVRLAVESSFGCVDTASGQAYVHAIDKFDIQVVNNCVSDSIRFSQTSTNLDSIARIVWHFPNGDSLIGPNVAYAFGTSGTYSIAVHQEMTSGCTNDTSINIQVDPDPIAQLIVDLPCDDDFIRAIDQSSTSAGVITTRSWSIDGNSVSNADTLTYVSPDQNTKSIMLVVQNDLGCSDTAREDIDPGIQDRPRFTFANACALEETYVINTTDVTNFDQAAVEFDMGDGSVVTGRDSFRYTYMGDGVYRITMTLTNTKGCSYDTAADITIYPLPLAGFKIFPEQASILNSDIEITDESFGADTVLYILSDGSTYGTRNFTHEFLDSGTYLLQQFVSSNYGCSDSTSKTVRINFRVAIWVPNSFSPDGSGFNDVFRPYGDGIGTYKLRIYNRWGEKIFESNDEGQPWRGENALPGVYLYRLDVIDYEGIPHYFKGTVQLLK